MKIYVNNRPGTLLNDIYLINEQGRDKFYGEIDPKGFGINWTLIKNLGTTDEVKPFITCNLDEMAEVARAFSEYAETKGIDLGENGARRELSATKYHLEDLRTLLKLK